MSVLAHSLENTAVLHEEVTTYLYDVFSAELRELESLDRWTQQRVSFENLAKITRVLAADNPMEHCYQNLLREIDTEAEFGIYLVDQSADTLELRELADDSGISGELHEHMETIIPVAFADDLADSNNELCVVQATIEARYNRARIDANVSEMIMSHLTGHNRSAADMSLALRSLLYSFHEDRARRISGLPPVLDEQSTRELVLMVSDLAHRADD